MSDYGWERGEELEEPRTWEHKEIEWDDEFQPVETRIYRWDLIADQLRQRPGKWAKIVGSAGRGLSQKGVNDKGTLCPVPLRQGRWQVATRHGELWLRYVSE